MGSLIGFILGVIIGAGAMYFVVKGGVKEVVQSTEVK